MLEPPFLCTCGAAGFSKLRAKVALANCFGPFIVSTLRAHTPVWLIQKFILRGFSPKTARRTGAGETAPASQYATASAWCRGEHR